MERLILNTGGLTITLASLILVAATLQWIVFATLAARSKERAPKKGLREIDRKLLGSSGAFLILWLAAFFVGLPKPPKVEVAAAAVTGDGMPVKRGTCSSLSTGMPTMKVRKNMGAPDEIRPDEETRGPSAAVWIYRDARCAVHVFEDKVEFID